ncbi:hypothetical protein Nepgr_028760 [Nepenthes gracilis]|uniref:Uncharacterized protein n=1 Tax=Nepenthes gracilis TaxID=150966 RepID=A0AAD3TCN4_NEPGR|nr:hypothetical protein Nepgr_028760 [Nepenthes gracilis]
MGGSIVAAKSTCVVLVIFMVAVALPVNAVTHRKILSSGSAKLEPSKIGLPPVPVDIPPLPSLPVPLPSLPFVSRYVEGQGN